MACALTSDYSLLDCKDGGLGGLLNAYFIEKGNVTAYTKASGVITTLTKATGVKFRKYALQRETATAEENIEASAENGSIAYNQTVSIVLNRNTTALRNEILLLAKNQLIIVIEDRNGMFWMYGLTGGMDLNKGKRGSGTKGVDRNGYELTFEGQEPELAQEVATAVATVLQTPG